MAKSNNRSKRITPRTNKAGGPKNTTKDPRARSRNSSSGSKDHGGLIRLNKYVANSGVCTRREADIYIAAGNVTVNGKPITEMGHKVKPTDEVRFDGRLLNPIKKEYVILNKPKDFVVTGRNEKGNRTVFGLISNASKSKLLPVDRLQKNSTGLLLFTNDGEMKKRLASPKNGLRKIYQVELDKNLDATDLKKIKSGISIDDRPIKVKEVSYVEHAPKNLVGIEIYSSRNGIVRRIFEELGYKVIRLDRSVYGPLTKKDLPRGHWRYLTPQEIVNFGMVQ